MTDRNDPRYVDEDDKRARLIAHWADLPVEERLDRLGAPAVLAFFRFGHRVDVGASHHGVTFEVYK